MTRVANARIHACTKCQGLLQMVQTLPGVRHLRAPGSQTQQARAPR
jgi:hypothetical protein